MLYVDVFELGQAQTLYVDVFGSGWAPRSEAAVMRAVRLSWSRLLMVCTSRR